MTKTKINVWYEHTDRMGIVHHSNYFPYFEQARTEFIKHSGISYSEMEADGILLPLVSCAAKFVSPSFYEDVLTVNTYLSELSAAKCKFTYIVKKGENIIAKGETVHAFTNENFKCINLKKYRPQIYELLCGLVENPNIS